MSTESAPMVAYRAGLPPTFARAEGRLGDDMRAVRIVWRRELIRFGRNRLRIVTSLVQPVLFLFVLGTGLEIGRAHV